MNIFLISSFAIIEGIGSVLSFMCLCHPMLNGAIIGPKSLFRKCQVSHKGMKYLLKEHFIFVAIRSVYCKDSMFLEKFTHFYVHRVSFLLKIQNQTNRETGKKNIPFHTFWMIFIIVKILGC